MGKWLCCLVLGLSCAARADYGVGSVTSRNVKVKITVSIGAPFGPFTADHGKVSGTNVNVNFNGGSENVDYQGQNPWNQINVVEHYATITGGTPKTWSWTPPDISELSVGNTQGRFASTHFEDGASVTITAYAKYRLSRVAGNQVLETTTVQTSTATIIVDAYNKGITYSTNVGTGPIPGAPGMAETTDDEQSEGRAGLTTAHHSITLSDNLLSKTQITGELDTVTALMMSAHGSASGIFDSYSNDPTDTSHFLSWFTITSAINSGRTVPAFNYVVLYSCDALAGAAQAAFNIPDVDANDPATWDKCIVGFDTRVISFLVPGNTDQYVSLAQMGFNQFPVSPAGYLKDHVTRAFDRWNNGSTIEDAIDSAVASSANAAFMPRGVYSTSGFAKVPMLRQGDPRTTLSRVYTRNSTESFYIGSSNGWLVWFPSP